MFSNSLKIILVLLLIIISGIGYYKITGNVSYGKIAINITRVIDGDTIDSDFSRIRLKGINCPEKNEFFYNESVEYMKNLAESKQAELEFSEQDKYQRILGYLFIGEKFINKELVEKGFAHIYYYEKDNYYNELKSAEEYARKNQLGIWKPSKYSKCIELINLQYEEPNGRCNNQEKLILKNNCNELDITIKDDATHIYKEKLNSENFEKNFSCIWNDEGDTLYIYADDGLILFYRY